MKKTLKVTVSDVEISSPDKIVFAGRTVTKLKLARYYAKVWERMAPYVCGRVLSLVVCPNGTGEECFYKKHPASGEHIVINDIKEMLALVQMNTLEIHTWGSKEKNLEQPDTMVFDLDPDEGLDLKSIRQGVRDLKNVLDGLGLTCFLKTSGNKGYHVVVPFKPTEGWEVFYGFARSVAELMQQKWPARYTTNVRKSARAGKIFVDYMRNGRGATSVVPYSVRKKTGAVAMPLAWSELNKIAPDGITMAAAIRRLAKPDPWASLANAARNQKIK